MTVTEEELKDIEDRRANACETVAGLCNRSRQWVMSIPARPDYDTDLVIGASLRDINHLLAELRSAREEIARMREAIEKAIVRAEDQVGCWDDPECGDPDHAEWWKKELTRLQQALNPKEKL